MNSFDNKENYMEQEKTKQESGRFFEQRETFSTQMASKWARYRLWLKQSLRRDPELDSSEVNNNPYQRGGICSYNAYLSGMLKAHLWGIWLTAVVVIVFYFGLGMAGFRSNRFPGLPIMLLVAAFWSFHWALISFICLEKRLRAIGMAQSKLRVIALASVGMTTAGIMFGWFIRFKRDGMAGNPLIDFAMSQYEAVGQIGAGMVYLGFAMLFVLPCYRNSDALSEGVKEELGKVQGYPTPILLVFHVLLLFPAVAILA